MRYHLYIAVPARRGRPFADVTRRCPGQPPPHPHVTLVGPAEITAVEREPELVRALRASVRAFAPLTVRYDGVTYFGRRHYICVRVLLTPALARRQQALSRTARRFFKPWFRPGLRYRPHITLAARLFEWEGKAIWRALKGRPFTGAFACREIRLMRQPEPGAPWQPLARLRLAGRPSDR